MQNITEKLTSQYFTFNIIPPFKFKRYRVQSEHELILPYKFDTISADMKAEKPWASSTRLIAS